MRVAVPGMGVEAFMSANPFGTDHFPVFGSIVTRPAMPGAVTVTTTGSAPNAATGIRT